MFRWKCSGFSDGLCPVSWESGDERFQPGDSGARRAPSAQPGHPGPCRLVWWQDDLCSPVSEECDVPSPALFLCWHVLVHRCSEAGGAAVPSCPCRAGSVGGSSPLSLEQRGERTAGWAWLSYALFTGTEFPVIFLCHEVLILPFFQACKDVKTIFSLWAV